MALLFVIRHALTEDGKSDYDIALSDLGVQQCLKFNQKNEKKFDLIISSNTKRAHQTAILISSGTADEIIHLQSLYPEPDSEIYQRVITTQRAVGVAEPSEFLKDTMLAPMLLAHGRNAWKQVKSILWFKSFQNALVVGHSLFINVMGMAASDVECGELDKIIFSHCGGYALTLSDDDLSVQEMNLI